MSTKTSAEKISTFVQDEGLAKIVKEQELKAVDRDGFKPRLNYLMPATEPVFVDHIKRTTMGMQGVTEFDLATQVLSGCMDYPTAGIWIGPDVLLDNVAKSAKDGDIVGGQAEFERCKRKGEIRLNMETIRHLSAKAADELLTVVLEGEANGLPIKEMNQIEKSPFGADERGMVMLDKNHHRTDTGTLYAIERYSGVKIEYRKVKSDLSQKYGKLLHISHLPSENEVGTFGAFLPRSDFPFAWVSYNRIADLDKLLFLHHFGFKPDNVVGLEQSWSAVWTPMNTMSLLYRYGLSQLVNDRPINGHPVDGILTTVNPNLGLAGSSFLASNFDIVALRPGRKVEVNNNGETPKTRDNLIYQIPVNEMLYTVDRNAAAAIKKKKIFVVDEEFVYKLNQQVTVDVPKTR
jgi:hypothetical protein